MFVNKRYLCVVVAWLALGFSCKQGGSSRVSQSDTEDRLFISWQFLEDMNSDRSAGFKELINSFGVEIDLDEHQISDIEVKQLASDPQSFEDGSEIYEPSPTPISYNVTFSLADIEEASCYIDTLKLPTTEAVGVSTCQNLPTPKWEEDSSGDNSIPNTDQNSDQVNESDLPSKIPVFEPGIGPLCTTGVDCDCDKEAFNVCKYFNGGKGCYNGNNKCNYSHDVTDKDSCLALKNKLNEHYLTYSGKTLTTGEKRVLEFAKNDESTWCDF